MAREQEVCMRQLPAGNLADVIQRVSLMHGRNKGKADRKLVWQVKVLKGRTARSARANLASKLSSSGGNES